MNPEHEFNNQFDQNCQNMISCICLFRMPKSRNIWQDYVLGLRNLPSKFLNCFALEHSVYLKQNNWEVYIVKFLKDLNILRYFGFKPRGYYKYWAAMKRNIVLLFDCLFYSIPQLHSCFFIQSTMMICNISMAYLYNIHEVGVEKKVCTAFL